MDLIISRDKNVVDATPPNGYEAQVFGGFWLIFRIFCRKLNNFRCFLSVICAAGGQHEEHTEYGSPVRDVVHKNRPEPQAEIHFFWPSCRFFRCFLLRIFRNKKLNGHGAFPTVPFSDIFRFLIRIMIDLLK